MAVDEQVAERIQALAEQWRLDPLPDAEQWRLDQLPDAAQRPVEQD